MTAASCITEEHRVSQARARTLNTTSKRMVFFPSFLLMMLSDPKVTLPPLRRLPKLESKGEDGSWKIRAGIATPPARRAFPPAALQGSCTRRARDTHPEPNKQWEIMVSASSLAVPIPRQSRSPLRKVREKPAHSTAFSCFRYTPFTVQDLAQSGPFHACKSTSQMPEGPALCPVPRTHISLLLPHNKIPHHHPQQPQAGDGYRDGAGTPRHQPTVG